MRSRKRRLLEPYPVGLVQDVAGAGAAEDERDAELVAQVVEVGQYIRQLLRQGAVDVVDEHQAGLRRLQDVVDRQCQVRVAAHPQDFGEACRLGAEAQAGADLPDPVHL